MKLLLSILRWILRVVVIVVAIVATLILVRAFESRKMPDLERWHREAPAGEFTAADLRAGFGLQEYLELENRLFSQLSELMVRPDELEGHSPLLRYVRGGPQDPARQAVNWNRTVTMGPGDPKGGVLLLHGLSDSPYSMRSVAELFAERGYYVLVMRMPGHGTVPAGLLKVRWEDWLAAVKIGARHVRGQIDDSMPFYLGGYSNGGALAVTYCLESITDDALPRPDRLFLFSPAIGITPFARIARWDRMYGFLPYFEKSKWLDILPEFDPYKFNSFPKNAGTQSWNLAGAIEARLDKLEDQGRISELPPILTFQSVVDDTVLAEDLITRLYDRLDSNGSEVVFFDVNHSAKLDGLLTRDHQEQLERLMQSSMLKYTVTRITNRDPDSPLVQAEMRAARSETVIVTPLDFEWPRSVFSLAHLAIPFPPDDPLYGSSPSDSDAFAVHIGTLALKGERRVLLVPASQLIRVRYNPFHDYMASRITEVIKEGAGAGITIE